MNDEGLAQTRRTAGPCGTESNAHETWDVDICSPEGVLRRDTRQEDSWLPPLSAGEISHWLGVILIGGGRFRLKSSRKALDNIWGAKKLGVSLPQVP